MMKTTNNMSEIQRNIFLDWCCVKVFQFIQNLRYYVEYGSISLRGQDQKKKNHRVAEPLDDFLRPAQFKSKCPQESKIVR